MWSRGRRKRGKERHLRKYFLLVLPWTYVFMYYMWFIACEDYLLKSTVLTLSENFRHDVRSSSLSITKSGFRTPNMPWGEDGRLPLQCLFLCFHVLLFYWLSDTHVNRCLPYHRDLHLEYVTRLVYNWVSWYQPLVFPLVDWHRLRWFSLYYNNGRDFHISTGFSAPVNQATVVYIVTVSSAPSASVNQVEIVDTQSITPSICASNPAPQLEKHYIPCNTV